MAIELATAYVSIVPETSKLEEGVKAAMSGVGKHADAAGKDIGNRLAQKASKALKDGWRPDQDLMAGIPNTKLDRIGARMGQIIGKGVVGGLKARQLGREFGTSFASGAGSIGIGSVVSGWRRDLQGQSNKLGFLAGKALSAGLTAAVGVGVAGVGLALTKGFNRLVVIDTAKQKLRNLGKSAEEVAKISTMVVDSVTGTPFAMDAAFSTATKAIGTGVEDIERFMKNVADAAGFAGTDLERMGDIFNQVQLKGKVTGDEMMRLIDAGLPAKSWIQKSYNLTSDQFEKMQQDGEITMEMLQKSIERNAPGMAKALGDTLQGSIDNMQTAIARVGANFLSAIFGGATGDETEGMKDAVQRITDALNRLDNWIKENKDKIRQFFIGAKDAAGTVLTVLGSIGTVLAEHPGLIQTVVVAFAALQAIKFVGLIGSLGTVSGLLAGMAANPVTLALIAIAAGGVAGGMSLQRAIEQMGEDSEGGRNALNQATAPGMGVPGASRDPMFAADPPSSILDSFDPAASRERRGRTPSDPTGGLLGGTVSGTAGQGYFNSNAAANALDKQMQPLTKAFVKQKAAEYGLVVTSENRNTKDLHGAGRAIDVSNGTGNTPQMEAFAKFFANNYGSQLLELIYSSPTFSNTIKNGNPLTYDAATQEQHRNHVHLAFDTGGWLPPGETLVQNDTGKPELVLNPDQQKNLAQSGVDPNTLLHGTGANLPPGPVPHGGAQMPEGVEQPNQMADFTRAGGFVPVAAGSTGVAGTSSLASVIGMGNEVVGGLIDTGASLAQTAISMGVAAGTFGAGAAAGPAASAAAAYGIQTGAAVAKRASQFGFDALSIGADSLIAQLFPFGAPRFIGYDYTQFAPEMGLAQAAIGSLEQMGSEGITNHFAQQGATPGAPTQPQQMPGMQTPIAQGPIPGPSQTPLGQGPLPGPPPSAPPTVPPPTDLLSNLMQYDQGGMLPPGGMGINMTRRPEPVLTPQQWDSISQLQPAGRDAPLVKIDAIYGLSPEDVAGQIESKQKLAMMRYSGRP